MLVLWIVLLSLLSALFYRLGGWGGSGRTQFPTLPAWIFDTKARDIGCPIIGLGAMFVMGVANVVPWWINLISFLALFGSLTTYYDSVPWNKGKDNFYMHGCGIALAYLPYAIVGGVAWPGMLIRILCVTLAIGLWSKINTNGVVEEAGRGFLIIVTLPLLLIGGV